MAHRFLIAKECVDATSSGQVLLSVGEANDGGFARYHVLCTMLKPHRKKVSIGPLILPLIRMDDKVLGRQESVQPKIPVSQSFRRMWHGFALLVTQTDIPIA